MKVEEYVKIYYEIYRKPKHRENTQEIYESCIRLYITGSELGETNLSTVTTLTVQKHLTELLVRNLSRHTVNKIRQILISAFEQASSEGLIAKNFAKFTEPIPLIWRDNPIFTPDIQKRFLQKCRNRRFYVAYVLLFYLGMRRSEVLGLSWNNVDMKRNILYIRQTLIVIKGKPVLQRTTKTRRSLRTIPFPFEIKCLLQERREHQRTEKRKSNNWNNPDNLIFTSRDGSPYNPNYFSRNFRSTVKKLGLGNLHLHSARHTWATNMLRIGIPISDVQTLGGWSRPDTLLTIYAHSVQENHRKAMKKLYKEMTSDK